jgi:signal transduction histidine kinase
MGFDDQMLSSMVSVSELSPVGGRLLAAALPDSTSLTAFALVGLLAAGLGIAVLNVRRTRKTLEETIRRKGELEYQLNEIEQALYSQSQLLIVWRGNVSLPIRVVGSMNGAVTIPERLPEAANFADWLERDSATVLTEKLSILKQSGKPFNIGIKTLQGELLEADGRPAGAHATLQLRPLAGERRQITELSYDASKLSKQVERLSAILDSAPFPAWIKDAKGPLIWANRAYVTALEMPDLKTTLTSSAALYRAEDVDTTKALPKAGVVGRARTVLRGAVRVFNIVEQPLEGAVAGFAIDITAQEEVEKELERHIKAHASTLDKLDTAIAIFGPDQRLRFFNQAYATLWNLDVTWLKTQPSDGEILDQLRTARQLPEQANYREWKSRQLQSYTTLETREAYWYLPDGRSLHVVCEQHPFGGVTYLFENQTKELQLESRYNALTDEQRETLDNLAVAVALFGSDGRLRLFNPAFANLWQLPANAQAEHIHVDKLSSLKGLGDEARAAWQDIRYALTGLETSRRKLEGQFAHDGVDLKYLALPLADGNALLTFSDVSDAVRAEKALLDRAEALEQADRLKGSFLEHVSYEVRTPLTSISGFAEALDIGMLGELTPKQQEYVLNIRKSSDDLSAIIDAMIDLSAVDAGAMGLNLEMVDIAGVLEEAGLKHLPALERRDISLKIDVASDLTTMVADRHRLLQIVSHLLSNAIGFSEAKKEVHLGARRTGEMIQIWVADQGRGIDPEFQGKAFERFQSKPMPGGHRGPGLGLSIVKSFTELHGGTVSLSSTPKKGTTVVCLFPRGGPVTAAASAA